MYIKTAHLHKINVGGRKIVNGKDNFYEKSNFTTGPGTAKRLYSTVTEICTRENGTVVHLKIIDESNYMTDKTGHLKIASCDKSWGDKHDKKDTPNYD